MICKKLKFYLPEIFIKFCLVENGVRIARFVKLIVFVSIISNVDKRLSVRIVFDVSFTVLQPCLISCGISIKFKMTKAKIISFLLLIQIKAT